MDGARQVRQRKGSGGRPRALASGRRGPVANAFLLARVIAYSNQVQQPRRPTAILGSCPHTRQAARFDHEQDRAGSYGSEGRATRPARVSAATE